MWTETSVNVPGKRTRRRRAAGIGVAVLACVLAACTSDGDPAGDAAATATAATGGAVATASPAPTTATGTAPATDAATATDPAGGVGGLLVASDRGVDVVEGGESRALTSIPASRAYADGAGGVVFQGVAPPQPGAPSAAVLWLPPDGSDAVTVVEDGAAGTVTLHDAAVVDGQPTAVYTERSGDSPDTVEQRLVLLPLPDGEPRRVRVVGGPEWGSSSVSVGGDTLGMLVGLSAENWFSFVTTSGDEVTVTGNPLPEDEPCEGECPTAMTLDSDGARMAWATQDTVTVTDVDGGGRRSFPLPEVAGQFVRSLDLVGDDLVVNWMPPPAAAEAVDGEPPASSLALRLDVTAADGAPAEVSPAGFATLTGS